MKTKLPLFIFSLIFTILLPAQECTKPDTALVRKNKVKMVTVYFEGNNSPKTIHHTYEYNERGQLMSEREGERDAKTTYRYDSKNRVTEIAIVTGANTIYNKTSIAYPEGKKWREVSYFESNGGQLILKMVYRYDSLERMIYQAWYNNNEMTHVQYLFPSDAKGPVDARDSVISQHQVYWRSKGQLTKLIQYDAQWKNPVTTSYFYSVKDGSFEKELIEAEGKQKINIPVYDAEGMISDVNCDGHRMNAQEKKNWIEEHRAFPKPQSFRKGMDDGLPYADPVPDRIENRTPVFGKNGLMKEETIESRFMNAGPVKFSYEYKYF
jgi:hypothetical protein